MVPNERMAEMSTPSVIEWTADKPAVSGYYWFRHPTFTGRELTNVYECEEGGETGLFAYSEGWVSNFVKNIEGGEWAGPLPELTERGET